MPRIQNGYAGKALSTPTEFSFALSAHRAHTVRYREMRNTKFNGHKTVKLSIIFYSPLSANFHFPTWKTYNIGC